MQWLDAEPVTRQKQRGLIPVIQSEREHSAKPRHACLAPSFPCVHDHFRIASRAERVTECRQLQDQSLIVINLSIEDDDDTAVLIPQRLLSGRKIDNRQPSMSEADASLDVQAAFVRPAMVLRLVHS